MGFCGLFFFLTPESERLNLSFLVDAAQSLSVLFLILSFSPPLHSSGMHLTSVLTQTPWLFFSSLLHFLPLGSF